MAMTRVVVTLDQATLSRLDHLVQQRVFPNRSKAIESAVQDKLARFDHSRLAIECAKLDPRAEQQMAEEGMAPESATWPQY